MVKQQSTETRRLQPLKRAHDRRTNPRAHIQGPVRQLRQLRHDLPLVDPDLPEPLFAVAIGNSCIQSIKSCSRSAIKNSCRVIYEDLPRLIGNAVVQAELGSTKGETARVQD